MESRIMRGLMCVLLVTLFVVVLAPPTWAQSPTGGLRGVVTDPTGAVVPDASVIITELSSGRTITLKSNNVGIYAAPLLLPGEYKIAVRSQQFAPMETRVTVQAGQTADVNAKL